MTAPEMTIEDTPVHDDIHVLGDRLDEFNARTTGYDDGRELAIFLRDKFAEIVGGLYGWTWAGWLEVRYLWVDEDLRGHGHGRRLLLAAEEEALKRGCARVLLDTFSFQAPDFYRHLGYQEITTIENFPASTGGRTS